MLSLLRAPLPDCCIHPAHHIQGRRSAASATGDSLATKERKTIVGFFTSKATTTQQTQLGQPTLDTNAGNEKAKASPALPHSSESPEVKRSKAKFSRRSFFGKVSDDDVKTIQKQAAKNKKIDPQSVKQPWYSQSIGLKTHAPANADAEQDKADVLSGLIENLTIARDGAYCTVRGVFHMWDPVNGVWRAQLGRPTVGRIAVGANHKTTVLTAEGALVEIDSIGNTSSRFPPITLPEGTHDFAVSFDGSVAFVSTERPGQIGFLDFNCRKKGDVDNIVWMKQPDEIADGGAKSMIFTQRGKLVLLDNDGELWEAERPAKGATSFDWKTSEGLETNPKPRVPRKLKKPGPHNTVSTLSRDGTLVERSADGKAPGRFPPVRLPGGTTEFAVSRSGVVAFYSSEHPGEIGFLTKENREKIAAEKRAATADDFDWVDLPPAPQQGNAASTQPAANIRAVNYIAFTANGEIEIHSGKHKWTTAESGDGIGWTRLPDKTPSDPASRRLNRLGNFAGRKAEKTNPTPAPTPRLNSTVQKLVVHPDGSIGGLDENNNLMSRYLDGSWHHAPVGAASELDQHFSRLLEGPRGGWNVVGLAFPIGYGTQNQFKGVKDKSLLSYFKPNMFIEDYPGQKLWPRHKQWWKGHFQIIGREMSENVKKDIKASHNAMTEFLRADAPATPATYDKDIHDYVAKRSDELLEEICDIIEMDPPPPPPEVSRVWRSGTPKTSKERAKSNDRVTIMKEPGILGNAAPLLIESHANGSSADVFPPLELPRNTYDYTVSANGSVAVLSKDHPGQIGMLLHTDRPNAVANGDTTVSADFKWMTLPTVFLSEPEGLVDTMTGSYGDAPRHEGRPLDAISFIDDQTIELRDKEGGRWLSREENRWSAAPVPVSPDGKKAKQDKAKPNVLIKKLSPSMQFEINAAKARQEVYENFRASPAKVHSNDNVLFVVREARRKMLGGKDDAVTNRLTDMLNANKFMSADTSWHLVSRGGLSIGAHINNIANLSSELMVLHQWELENADTDGAQKKGAVLKDADGNKMELARPEKPLVEEDSAVPAKKQDDLVLADKSKGAGTNLTADTDNVNDEDKQVTLFRKGGGGGGKGKTEKKVYVPQSIGDTLYILNRFNEQGIFNQDRTIKISEILGFFRAAFKEGQVADKAARALTAQGTLGVRPGEFGEEGVYGYTDFIAAWTAFIEIVPNNVQFLLKLRKGGGLDLEGMSQFLKLLPDEALFAALKKMTGIGINVQVFGIEPVNQASTTIEHAISISTSERHITFTLGKKTDLNVLPFGVKLQHGIGMSKKFGDTVFFIYAGLNEKIKIGYTRTFNNTVSFTVAKDDFGKAQKFFEGLFQGKLSLAEILEMADKDFTSSRSETSTWALNLDFEPLLASGIVGDPLHHNFSTIGKLILAPAVEQLNLAVTFTGGITLVLGGNAISVTYHDQTTPYLGWTHISVFELQGVPNTNNPPGPANGYEDQQKVPVAILVAQKQLWGKAIEQGGFTMRVNNETNELEAVGMTIKAAPHKVSQRLGVNHLRQDYLTQNVDITKENIPALIPLLRDHPELVDILEKLKKSGRPISIEMEMVPGLFEGMQKILKHAGAQNESMTGLGPEVQAYIAAVLQHPGSVRIKKMSISKTETYSTGTSTGATLIRYQSGADMSREQELAGFTVVYPDDPNSTAPSVIVPTGALASILNVPDLKQIERIHRAGGEDLWDFAQDPLDSQYGGDPLREQYAPLINDILMELRTTPSLVKEKRVKAMEEVDEYRMFLAEGRTRFANEKPQSRKLLEEDIAENDGNKADLLDQNWAVLNTKKWTEKKQALAAFFPGKYDGLDRERILQLLNDPAMLKMFMLSVCKVTNQPLPQTIEKLEPETAVPEASRSTFARVKSIFQRTVETVPEEDEDLLKPSKPARSATEESDAMTGTDIAKSESSKPSQITHHSRVGTTIPGLEGFGGANIDLPVSHLQRTARGNGSTIGALTTEGSASRSRSGSDEFAAPVTRNSGTVLPRRVAGRPSVVVTSPTPQRVLSDSEGSSPIVTSFADVDALTRHLAVRSVDDVIREARPSPGSLYDAVYGALPLVHRPRYPDPATLRRLVVQTALSEENRERIANYLFENKQPGEEVSAAEVDQFLVTLGTSGNWTGDANDIIPRLIATTFEGEITIWRGEQQEAFETFTGNVRPNRSLDIELTGSTYAPIE
jgi:hypothetical protein